MNRPSNIFSWQAAPTNYFRRALIGSVTVLFGLAGCSTTPIPQENAQELTAAGSFKVERRYKIEARFFKALDETWYDSPWFAPWISDEVMVILRDPERRVMTISHIFGDVDTNETRSFGSQENCILPVSNGLDKTLWADEHAWTCSEAGVAGPFHFVVEMYEADDDTWNGLYNCFVNLACAFSITTGGYSESSSGFTDGDELIGKQTLTFSAEELVAALPYVNDYVEETITLGPCFDERGCVESPGLPTGPEYTFTWRVTRLPDKRVVDFPGPFHPIDPTP